MSLLFVDFLLGGIVPFFIFLGPIFLSAFDHFFSFFVAPRHILLNFHESLRLHGVESRLVALRLHNLFLLGIDAFKVVADTVHSLLLLVVAELVLLLHPVAELLEANFNLFVHDHFFLHRGSVTLHGVPKGLEVTLELCVDALPLLFLPQEEGGVLLLTEFSDFLFLDFVHLFLRLPVLFLVGEQTLCVLVEVGLLELHLVLARFLGFLHFLLLFLHDVGAAGLVSDLAVGEGLLYLV